jgi:hypothetical protein
MEVVFTGREQSVVALRHAMRLGPRFQQVFERELTSRNPFTFVTRPVDSDPQDAAYRMVRESAHFIRFGASRQDIDGYFNAYIRMYCQGPQNRMRLAFAQALQRATHMMASQVYRIAGHNALAITI